MIERIDINKYRKFECAKFSFGQYLNVISGTNGTCKTSLLHIVSNTFKRVRQDPANPSIKSIVALNSQVNPSIETLTKGDSQYNDPAHGVSGTLLTVTEFGGEPVDFRRHTTKNDKVNKRYRLIPKYPRGSGQKKTELPVVYLGLKRLYPFGEMSDKTTVKKVSPKLGSDIFEEVAKLYQSITYTEVKKVGGDKLGEIKVRPSFVTNDIGIDSNTISSGEDNLFIILTALVSLKHYYVSLDDSRNQVESILLVDELDATLHPAYQIKLLDLFRDFSLEYKIQVFFTTHSLTLLGEALKDKSYCNVHYLIDNIKKIDIMPDPDIYKIEQHLRNATRRDIYTPSLIPVFTEDDEARIVADRVFEYIAEKDAGFRSIKGLFHFVESKISCDNLKTLFLDDKLLKPTLRSICMLDGDQRSQLENHITTLPGNKSPEDMIFSYAEDLFNNDQGFWCEEHIIRQGWAKKWYQDKVQARVSDVDTEIALLKEKGISTRGIRRERYKKIFNDQEVKPFLICVLQKWINDSKNAAEIKKFVQEVFCLFNKVSSYHDINRNDWAEIDKFFLEGGADE